MTIDLLIQSILYLFFFLFPLFYLPITAEFYEYNKMFLLIGTVILLLFLTLVKFIKNKKIIFVKSNFQFELLLLVSAVAISTLIQSRNILAFITPLSTSTIIALVLLYFLLLTYIEKHEIFMTVLVFDALIITLFVMLHTAQIIPKGISTPAGSFLATAIFLTLVSIYLLSSLAVKYLKHNEKKHLNPFFYLLSFIFITAGSILTIIEILTNLKPIFLPFSIGWPIFLETLKNTKTFFLGVGPSNFLTAFTLAKPSFINQLSIWNLYFTSSSSFLLTLATEAGIVAALLFLLLPLKLLKSLRLLTTHNLLSATFPFTITLICALILQIIFPSNMTVLSLTFILLAFSAKKQTKEINLKKLGKFLYFFYIPLIALFSLIIYLSGRIYLAEIYFKKSLDAQLNNQGKETYDWQKLAIATNPYLDRYHLSFSKTNLALASALTTKENLTEEDQRNIPMLVKQAIDEAKIAVTLNKTSAINWDNLASTYLALVNFAQGADEFAIRSYQQKIILDPYNPNNYLSLGSLLMRLNRLDEAEKQLKKAIELKTGLPNAHYFLAQIAKEKKDYKQALEQLKITAGLVNSDSNDGKKVSQEISEISKMLPQEASSSQIQTENLNLEDISVQEASPSIMMFPSAIPTISL